MDYKKLVEKYLCPGCSHGSNINCFEHKWNEKTVMCKNHSAGTFILGVGRILLGLPKGFNRCGKSIEISIEEWKDMPDYPYDYSKFNIPVWKYFDGECTLVRGLCPRINKPFLTIFNGDVRSEIDCLEIFEEDFEEMD